MVMVTRPCESVDDRLSVFCTLPTINSIFLQKEREREKSGKLNHGVRCKLMVEKGTRGGSWAPVMLCFLIEALII